MTATVITSGAAATAAKSSNSGQAGAAIVTNDDTAAARWEAAYLRFETPEQERAKFRKRLLSLGVLDWQRDVAGLELFCGRGNGLHVWQKLGFLNVAGLDISQTLLDEYDGPARTYAGDARALPLETASLDLVSVQGGLHHLVLMDDLERTVAEIHRVLKPGGRFLAVEPWLTGFLRVAHFACDLRPIRRCWPKLDALATMIELERDTYEDWLSRPDEIVRVLHGRFKPVRQRIGWGKLTLSAVRRD